MKRPFFFLFFLSVFLLKAQEPLKPATKDTVPFIFVGGGTGINSTTGMLGVLVSVKASDEFFLQAGWGIGGWGRKFSAGFKYELKKTNSWGFGINYSTCSGQDRFNTVLETSDSGKVAMRSVTIQLMRCSNINLITSYKWIFKKHHRFYLDLGYAIPVETEPYRALTNSTLTSNGKSSLNRRQPGGLIIGFGVLFGVQ